MGVLRDHPELALFLCLAAGYLVGKLRVGPITLGGICGALIVSLLVGTRHVSVDADVETVSFGLFILPLGYMAGPQFCANLNRGSLRFFTLCLIGPVCVLGIAYGLAEVFDLDVGTAAGILAGAATKSAVVGTATEAIGKLVHLAAEQVSPHLGHVATAYTVCYSCGLITIVSGRPGLPEDRPPPAGDLRRVRAGVAGRRLRTVRRPRDPSGRAPGEERAPAGGGVGSGRDARWGA